MAKIDLEKLICSLAERNIFLRDALKKQGLEYKDGEIVESQKPKFKVGDWVINRTDATIMQIINNTDFYETIKIGGQRETHTYNYVEWNFRLWSIEDAKDGDILQLGEVTAIFKEYIGNGYCKCYCSICEGEFEILIEEAGDNIFGCINTTPATKEQRDLLFAKMKEAGYKWDAKKKELKPIDNRFDYEKANIQQKDFATKAATANRQLYNRAILKLLSDYVEKYPDIRFGQMLCNLDVNPHFDEESREAYLNLSKTINKRKS